MSEQYKILLEDLRKKEKIAADLAYVPDVSEAEKAAVLKASAMLDLADAVENATLCAGSQPALRLTQNEWQLIAYALRIAADN